MTESQRQDRHMQRHTEKGCTERDRHQAPPGSYSRIGHNSMTRLLSRTTPHSDAKLQTPFSRSRPRTIVCQQLDKLSLQSPPADRQLEGAKADKAGRHTTHDCTRLKLCIAILHNITITAPTGNGLIRRLWFDFGLTGSAGVRSTPDSQPVRARAPEFPQTPTRRSLHVLCSASTSQLPCTYVKHVSQHLVACAHTAQGTCGGDLGV